MPSQEPRTHEVDVRNAGWLFEEGRISLGDILSFGNGCDEILYEIDLIKKRLSTLQESSGKSISRRDYIMAGPKEGRYLNHCFTRHVSIPSDYYTYLRFLNGEETFTDGAGI